MTNGFIIAAPHSGSGKTIVTIGLLCALERRGHNIAPAKIGPDYIDPQFHGVAAGGQSFNLDGWAMRQETLSHLSHSMADRADLMVIEGVMGLFDGAIKPGLLGHGATADLARHLDLPVILVVDCEGMGQSVAAMVHGFAQFDRSVKVAGVILNKLGSMRHISLMKEALDKMGMPVIGALPRDEAMSLPSRHLGLVQAIENKDIKTQINAIADHVEAHLDLDLLVSLSGPVKHGGQVTSEAVCCLGPFETGSHVAVAKDEAFQFFYPHLATVWQQAGVTVSYFSPLNNETPNERADGVFLPGGYPELHAKQLSENLAFLINLQDAAKNGKTIYGECGGYMVLGEEITDKEGTAHKMAGLLKLETSFERRKLHLGYRHVKRDDGVCFRAHEFHYSSIIRQEGTALFHAIEGDEQYGLLEGTVSGSYLHLIDVA